MRPASVTASPSEARLGLHQEGVKQVGFARGLGAALPLTLTLVLAACQLLAHIDSKDDFRCPTGTNQECITKNGGGPAICLRPQLLCQPVLSDACPTLLGSVSDDDTLLFGMIQDLRGNNKVTGTGRVQSVQLAVEEILGATGGIPSPTGGRTRPIAVVVCTENLDATSRANPTVAGSFLIDKLGVPAIIGAGNSGTTIALATSLSIPSHVLLFAPSATSDDIPSLSQGDSPVRLVWRIPPTNAAQAVALTDQIQQAADLATTSQAPARLAVLVKQDAFGTELWNLILQTDQLTINGAPVVTTPNADSLLVRQYPATPSSEELAAIASDVLAFAPNVVVSLGTGEAVTGIVAPVEKGWPSSKGYLPQWIFTDGGESTLLLAQVASDRSLQGRCRGTEPGNLGRLFDAFVGSYGSRFPGGPTLGYGASGAYDILHLLAYAAYAASAKEPGAPIDGEHLASGLIQVTSGSQAFSIGLDNPGSGFDALRKGGLSVRGAASGATPLGTSMTPAPYSFDVAAGEPFPVDVSVWCVSQQAPFAFASSGLYYAASSDPDAGVVTVAPGAHYNCPPH